MSDTTLPYEHFERGPMPRETIDGIPGYEILEELGRGGMGVVYRARQLSLNRIVALKMLIRHGATELDRFRVEAEAIGRLQHSNIIHVFEIGEVDGSPFFTLEYCPNGNLSRKIGRRPMGNREAAELIRELAEAMEIVHQSGIIHRDLKPANVLMSSDGTPKVTDFGIAKTNQDSTHTQTGIILGTPSYMAPEQAEGMNKDVGPAADVYSLGAILYECLTGRPPFVAGTTLETIRQVLEQEPLPPRLLNHAADQDLEKITLKCLQKRPSERYSSASELAADLKRYLDGEPITARSVNLFERLHRELHRNQHEAKLRPWGAGIMWLGAIIFAAQTATSILLMAGVFQPVAFWGPRIILFVLIGFWLRRYGFGNGLLPSNPLERMLWATWIGYLLAFAAMFLVMEAMGHGHLEIYGPAMVLSGMAWFTMGGCVWGGCYVIGLLFLVASPGMTWLNETAWGPGVFGAAWGATLLALGARYMIRSRSHPGEDS
ncbi:serine/threonine-protein kinase [Zavarzinella formosa]|uniref:serine/threonine-protein kinase n=1 Tax=Zavarzinella formosa TaxID=360055 RepID=UPI0002DC47D8|nr:serine/threonine-protein kinase [Zavarzinella formosa]